MSGSVTNPTGSVAGKSLTGLQDAETLFSGITEAQGSTFAQWQLQAILSDKAGVCSRYVGGLQTWLANELALKLLVTGKNEEGPAPWAPPAADLPLTLTVNTWLTTSDGVDRLLQPYFSQASRNGHPGQDVAATSGTVTYTAIDDTAPDAGQTGSYDVYFGTDHVTGSFVAPKC